ncbi:MAG: argininosuccinate lyase, partial [Halobacteriaceae archaeon]
TALKGLPRAYNRDLQRVTPHAWDAFDAVVLATDVAAGAVATASWPADALADAAAEGFATATGVADRLAMAGVPFRAAHEAVARAAEAAEGDAPTVEEVDAAVAAVTGDAATDLVSREDLVAALDPAASVTARDSLGGPAPERVREARTDATDALAADEDVVTDRAAALEAAADRRRREVDRYG